MANRIETYEIKKNTTKWVHTGGECWVAVALCERMLEDGEELVPDHKWLAMSDDYFCIYDTEPFIGDDSDEETDLCWCLSDPDVKARHGHFYNFGEWTDPGNAMLDLYNFYDNCYGRWH